MNISFENPDKVSGLLTLVVEEADIKKDVNKTIEDYRKKANIPGFRPGKAPLSLIKRQFGMSIKMDAINKLVGEQLQKYIKDNDIQMLGEPMASESQEPQDRSLHLQVRHRHRPRVQVRAHRPRQGRLLPAQG